MQQSHSKGGVGRLAAQMIVAIIGVVLIAAAAAADTAWVDRHILPNYFRPHSFFVDRVNTLRVVVAGIGLLILVGGPRWIARMAPGEPKRRVGQAMIAGVVVLIFVFGAELLLRKTFDPERRLSTAVPAKQVDERLGAALLPNQLTSAMQSGRRVEYATDANGARVARAGAQLDLGVPTIIFVGDSTMMGLGLQADESIPQQAAMRLGVQAANLAVNGYSTDQAAMRLQAMLPKFADPQAVVVLFASVLLDRNLDEWRPHLDQRMEWQPPNPSWRLRQFGAALLPYRSAAEVEYGIVHTRAVLAHIVAQARQHGAQPLIVVPVFVPESPDAAQVRHRMFDGTGLPVLLVPIDTNWRLLGDGHPDARAARVIGAAVAAKLSTPGQ